jgi:hypothetical protein
VNKSLRRLIATLTLAGATITGTALTTATAHADETTTAAVDDVQAPAAPTGEPAVTPQDTWWG